MTSRDCLASVTCRTLVRIRPRQHFSSEDPCRQVHSGSSASAAGSREKETVNSRADLHVHSRYSDRPRESLLRAIGAQECYIEPLEVYRRARARGMQFVTLTDHDTIDGGLEIAHLPGVFLSCEVTACFPEDGVAIHLLVWGIGEVDFEEIQRLQRDLYGLRRYLVTNGIPHAVAHPFYRPDRAFGFDHLEKLLVLFSHFEARNGTREPLAHDLFEKLVASLSPTDYVRMAERQGLELEPPYPFQKKWTGGSDDHSGLYVGTTWTSTPHASSVEEFLEHLRAGRLEPGGEVGSVPKMARSLRAIALAFLEAQSLRPSRFRSDPLTSLLQGLIEGVDGKDGSKTHWIPFPSRKLTGRGPIRRLLAKGGSPETPSRCRARERAELEQAALRGDRLARRGLEAAQQLLESRNPLLVAPAITNLAGAAIAWAPIAAAHGFQHVDDHFLRAARQKYGLEPGPGTGPELLWVTDTIQDLNGVAHTVRSTVARARSRGLDWEVLATGEIPPDIESAAPFRPQVLAELSLPEYPGLFFRFPKPLEMIAELTRREPRQILISTPGPLGLATLLAARLLSIPVAVVHHTDFPSYLDALGFGTALSQLSRRYLAWFYGQADLVLCPTRTYARELRLLGVRRSRLRDFPHGVDTDRFRPDRRDPVFRHAHASPGSTIALYVGRISREKGLDDLWKAWPIARTLLPELELVLVGDGPDRPRLESCKPPGTRFLGALFGDELARAYASADFLVFPSRTDTFGNVVLEAHASGLPVLAAANSGPAEQIRHLVDGLVCDAEDPQEFARGIVELGRDPGLRARLGQAGRQRALQASWDLLVEALANLDRNAQSRHELVVATRALAG